MLTPMLAQILIALSVTFLWLYLNGNEYTTITGGWVSQAWGSFGWLATEPSLSKQPTYMITYLTNTGYPARSGVIRITNPVDLSAISAIRVTLSAGLSGASYNQSGGQTIYLIAAAATSGSWPSITPSAAGVTVPLHSHTGYNVGGETLTSVQYTADVSGLPDGSYYICIGFMWYYQAASSSIRIEAVEMIAG